MKNKKEISILGFIGLLILSASLTSSLIQFETVDTAAMNKIIKRLSISDTVVSPIFIDGDATGIGAHNWSWVEGQVWFGGGNGSISNPYIIEDLIINGGNTVSCIEIRDSGVYFIIRSCTLYNSGFTPTPYKAGIFLENVNNGTIIRNNISYNGGHGISLTNSEYNVIEDNLISDNYGRGIAIMMSHFNFAINNSLYRNGQNIYLDESNYNQIYNNTVRDTPTNGGIVMWSGCSFNNLSYNIIDNDLWFGIYDSQGNHNTIFRNLISNTTDTGILLTNNNNCSIIENIVENNQNNGIVIEKSNNMTVTDNSVSKNLGSGLTFRGTTTTQFHKILRNNFTYNDWGLSVSFTQHSLISSNNISHNINNGLFVVGWNNTITKNTITNNGQGLFMNFGDNNNITQNNISNNLGYGINTDGGHFNLIYNNIFYGNTPNGINYITFNYWDNGIIGNYWDDYVGLDVNDDGIGDIPYTKGKIGDNFPFYWDPPVIDIVAPVPEASGLIAPSFNILISEGVAHSMWYTIEGGTTKYYFIDLVANINQTEWDKYGNENITIQFYVNDSKGFEGFTEVIILKETIAPTSIISYTAFRPTNIINTTSTFTITATDLGGSGIQLIRYKINDSSWNTYDKPFNFSGYSSGFYLITYQAIDNAGNVETENTLLVELIRIPSEPSTIPGYDLVIMIGTISLVSMLLIKKRFQK